MSVAEGRVKTSIRVDEYTWTRFQARTKELGLSTCFVLEQLMRLWTFSGTDMVPGMVARELHLHVNYGVQRPRRYPRPSPKEVHLWPPDCKEADTFWKNSDPGKSEVGCLKMREILPLSKCWDCFMAKEVV
jgi:hypothetical protein